MSAVEGGVAPAAAHVALAGLRKSFGAAVAVADFSLSVPRGSFTTLLGPSGSGKTTVLRLLAGFLEPDAGSVTIGGVDQSGRPPNLRGTGMVFQDYALFPHMTVRANVEYGLRMQGLPRASRSERAQRTLALLDLAGLAERYPHELSGGQQQRVALGRVIVLEPEVLLMDEPLSNLDAKLRLRLRAELKALQRQLGITTVYVTHDQEEALSLSDQVVVMDKGRIQQVGAPETVYRRPANRFVAEFVGQANLLPVTVRGVTGELITAEAGGQALLARLPDARRPAAGAGGLVMVRPEHVSLSRGGAARQAGAWHAEARVASRGFFGTFTRYWLELQDGRAQWLVDVPSSVEGDGGSVELEAGAPVGVSLAPGAACWLW